MNANPTQWVCCMLLSFLTCQPKRWQGEYWNTCSVILPVSSIIPSSGEFSVDANHVDQQQPILCPEAFKTVASISKQNNLLNYKEYLTCQRPMDTMGRLHDKSLKITLSFNSRLTAVDCIKWGLTSLRLTLSLNSRLMAVDCMKQV